MYECNQILLTAEKEANDLQAALKATQNAFDVAEKKYAVESAALKVIWGGVVALFAFFFNC